MKTKQKTLALTVMALCCALFTACPKEPKPDDTPTVEIEIDLRQYIPFSTGNKLATLSGNASIQLSGNLPRLDGATALYPVYASFVQATYPSTLNYDDLGQGVLRMTTTPDAFTNLINGNVDIIFTAPPSQNQIATSAEKGKEFDLTAIGKDAFVFFVNKNNPVNNLTVEQIQGIYSGAITNWSQVGGNNIEILAYQRPPNSGSQTALEFIMGSVPIMTPPINRTGKTMTGIFEEVIAYRNHSNAIGFSFLFFTTEMVNSNEIKLLSIEGVPPTRETIRTGKYPFSDSFYAITTGNETENMQKLIEWILSDEGQYLIEKTGYVSIK
jgi:phosphate transport system substrate-binding protein